jgi:hypothetical protein
MEHGLTGDELHAIHVAIEAHTKAMQGAGWKIVRNGNVSYVCPPNENIGILFGDGRDVDIWYEFSWGSIRKLARYDDERESNDRAGRCGKKIA